MSNELQSGPSMLTLVRARIVRWLAPEIFALLHTKDVSAAESDGGLPAGEGAGPAPAAINVPSASAGGPPEHWRKRVSEGAPALLLSAEEGGVPAMHALRQGDAAQAFPVATASPHATARSSAKPAAPVVSEAPAHPAPQPHKSLSHPPQRRPALPAPQGRPAGTRSVPLPVRESRPDPQDKKDKLAERPGATHAIASDEKAGEPSGPLRAEPNELQVSPRQHETSAAVASQKIAIITLESDSGRLHQAPSPESLVDSKRQPQGSPSAANRTHEFVPATVAPNLPSELMLQPAQSDLPATELRPRATASFVSGTPRQQAAGQIPFGRGGIRRERSLETPAAQPKQARWPKLLSPQTRIEDGNTRPSDERRASFLLQEQRGGD